MGGVVARGPSHYTLGGGRGSNHRLELEMFSDVTQGTVACSTRHRGDSAGENGNRISDYSAVISDWDNTF
jgi:hypothetical protein